ncbi:MAG: hypothetical protein ACRDTG_21025 [Pseudonocardiaceae bacterium]
MTTTTIILMIVLAMIVLAVIGAVIYLQTRKQQSQRLRDKFGPEYDRSREHADGRREAEAELRRREQRQRKLELRTLEPGRQREFEQRWAEVQREFVDNPSRAVHNADQLVIDVMAARGYPVDDFDQRADDLSVQYPVVTGHYREARRIVRAHEQDAAGTEELRRALTAYRSLVDALLHDTGGHDQRTAKESQT